jgi:hypothetical protein
MASPALHSFGLTVRQICYVSHEFYSPQHHADLTESQLTVSHMFKNEQDVIKFLLKFFSTGIESRLDYIEDLGVGAIWLSPIYKSPMKDFGYDIQDFRDIDPAFGTMDDFQSLSKAMKERGKS